jgi:hypothetical protein
MEWVGIPDRFCQKYYEKKGGRCGTAEGTEGEEEKFS